jgi:hypothetical protein
MSDPDPISRHALVLVRVPEQTPTAYSLDDAARIAGVHPDLLRYYCRLGLFGEVPAQSAAEPVFDDDRLYELRRFEHYRRHHGVSRRSLRVLGDLWREVESLRAELSFLRRR